MDLVKRAQDYARLITEVAQKLEDPAFIFALTAGTTFVPPAKPNWKWHLQFLDLGLIEEASGVFVRLREGPN